jgi:hypothetical protein
MSQSCTAIKNNASYVLACMGLGGRGSSSCRADRRLIGQHSAEVCSNSSSSLCWTPWKQLQDKHHCKAFTW